MAVKDSRITHAVTGYREEYFKAIPPPGWYVGVMRHFVYEFDYIDERVAQIEPTAHRAVALIRSHTR